MKCPEKPCCGHDDKFVVEGLVEINSISKKVILKILTPGLTWVGKVTPFSTLVSNLMLETKHEKLRRNQNLFYNY